MSRKSWDLGSLCRTCMSNRAKFSSGTNPKKLKKSIYTKSTGWSDGPTLMELLQLVQPKIKVHAKDKLPKIMCRDCIDQLHMTYDFLQMCKDTDEKFRKMLREYDTANDDEPLGLVDPVHGFVVDKVELNESNVSTSHRRPEFEAMFVANWSDEEDDGMDFSDNPFGNDTDDEYDDGKPRETRKRKSTGKSLLKEHKNKISKQETPHPNEDGTVTCQECDKVLDNVTLWLEHIVEHSSTTKPERSELTNSGKDELRSLRKQFEKSDEDNKKIITTLTEELIALKSELKQIRNLPDEEDTSLLPPLPFQELGEFEDFDARLPLEEDMRYQLKYLIGRVGGSDMPAYLRKALKTIISDELAINLTWRGTTEKPSIQRFTTFQLIKSMLDLLRKIDERITVLNSKTERVSREIISVRSEIPSLRARQHGKRSVGRNIIPEQPMTTMEQYEALENQLQNEETFTDFVNELCLTSDKSCDKFVRKAWKQLFSDTLAEQFCWRGTTTKKCIRFARITLAIRHAFRNNFNDEDEEFDKLTQKHFQYAHDRLSKSSKYHAKKQKVDEDDSQES